MYRFTAGQEGHIFACHDAGNNAFVTVTTCHLIAFRNLTFLSDMNAYLFVYARGQFIAVFAAEHFNANDFTSFTVGNTQGAVANFTSFFTEDCTEQTFFSGKFSFAFRSNFTNQNIARAYFSTNADNATFIQIFQSFFRNVGDFAGDFFFTQFGIASIAVVFFNMNRSKYVSFDQIFI